MKRFSFNSNLVAPLMILIGLVILLFHLNQYNYSEQELGSDQIEEVIRYYATACYALEGAYPSNLEYLKKNYGLVIDEDHYIYYYDGFASNLLPDIKVIKKSESELTDE